MKKSILILAIAASLSATAATTDVTWTPEIHSPTLVTFHSGPILGDYSITLIYGGKYMIQEGESFTLSITAISDANTEFNGFANNYGTGLLATGDPYSHPKDNMDGNYPNYHDNEFGIYVGSSLDIQETDGTVNHQQKVELHFNNTNNKVSNYALNHLNDGDVSKLTLSFTLAYTAPDATGYSSMVFSANEGSDVTFDTLTIANPETSVLYESIRNWGTLSAPLGTVTTLSLTTSIPEPTTATLSLLALAGLAARRRRRM